MGVQIICPFVLDQFYWAERMAWIGVAPQALKPNHLCPPPGDEEVREAVSAVVSAVTEASRAGMRERASAWSRKICEEACPSTSALWKKMGMNSKIFFFFFTLRKQNKSIKLIRVNSKILMMMMMPLSRVD